MPLSIAGGHRFNFSLEKSVSLCLYNSAASICFIFCDNDLSTKILKKQAEDAGKRLSNVFIFCEDIFGGGQEMLILVTELTISYYSAHFISRYGYKEYFNHNKELLFYKRQKEIIQKIGDLDL